MDDQTFDTLTKAIAGDASRRRLLRNLAGAFLGAATGAVGLGRAGAQQNCRAFGETCRSTGAGNQCCSGLVCTGNPGTCVECRTAADCPAIQLGPCEARTCSNGQCGVGPAPAGTECRAAAGPCDVAEVCNGTSRQCPDNAFKPEGTRCRTGVGGCDVNEFCTGNSAICPPDETEPCPGNTICCTVGRHAGQCVARQACTRRGNARRGSTEDENEVAAEGRRRHKQRRQKRK
jgi:hypothetical protein